MFLIRTGIIAGITLLSSVASASGLVSLDQLSNSCTSAKDQCGNTCVKMNDGGWACTKMACVTEQDAVCLEMTVDVMDPQDPTMCTMQYEPVCGEMAVQCVTTPCEPIQQTYGNACVAGVAGATIIHEGECVNDVAVGGDEDEYGCKASAGYTRNHYLGECVRPWESETLVSRAYTLGMTKYSTVSDFQFDASITREQAAKIIVTALDQSGAEEWFIKQTEGSCEWSDNSQIDSTLREYLDRACRLGLIKGFDGKVMPTQVLTDTDTMTIITRAAQYIPALADYLAIVDLPKTNNKPISRGEVVKLLYSLVEEISTRINAEPTMDYIQLQKDLDEAKILWSGAKLSHYTMVQQRSCFCIQDYTRPMIYDVTNNIVDINTAVYADDNTKITIEAKLHTVQDAFAVIQKAIDDKVASLTVVYDDVIGYPKSVAIDTNFQIADEEQYLSFTIIGEDDVLLTGEYELTSHNNNTVSTGITLSFAANRAHMRVCNSMGGEYTATDKTISFEGMISTMMYCMDEKLMNIEYALGSLTKATYIQDETSLTLKTDKDTFVWTKK